MASLAARAVRNQAARARLDAALAALSKRLDIPVPAESRRMHDAELQPIVEVERFADFAESVLEAVERLAVEGEPPAGYAALTVKMLRAEAKERDLDIPANATKDDLVALLEEDDATTPEDEALESFAAIISADTSGFDARMADDEASA